MLFNQLHDVIEFDYRIFEISVICYKFNINYYLTTDATSFYCTFIVQL